MRLTNHRGWFIASVGKAEKGNIVGPDDIPTEALLADLDASVEILYHYARIYGKRNRFRKTARNDIL